MELIHTTPTQCQEMEHYKLFNDEIYCSAAVSDYITLKAIKWPLCLLLHYTV